VIDWAIDVDELSWEDPRTPPKRHAGCYPPLDRRERVLGYDEARALVPTVMAAFGCTEVEAEAVLLDRVDDAARARMIASWPPGQAPACP
jgi:hypothetical protein